MEVKYSERFYKNLKVHFKNFMNTFYKIDVKGLENIPEDSNYILAGNHLNILDSWLLITITDETLRFMVDKKLYNFKLGEWFFKKLGTVAVDTNTTDSAKNYNAIRTAVKLLKDGEKMVIFPEARTHNMKVNYKFKEGATAISKLSNKVIVPFGIKGTYIPFTKLEIVIGKPINFKELKINKEEENDYLEKTVRNLEPFDHSKVIQIEDTKQQKKLFKKKCS